MPEQTSDPHAAAHRILNAVASLKSAFEEAGLRHPLAIVVAGEAERRRLESLFAWAMKYPNPQPWEGTTIMGIKVIDNVAG